MTYDCNMERIRLRRLAEDQAQARAGRVPLHLQPHTAQYPPTAQIQGRSEGSLRQAAFDQRTTASGRANTSPPLFKSKQLVTAQTAAPGAPALRPAKAPAGGKVTREFLPSVAGLARRGQLPPTQVNQFKTSLARPGPNKKMPRTVVQNLRVLENRTATTCGIGDASDLIDQISERHAQWMAEMPKSSFTYFGRTDDDVNALLMEGHFPDGRTTRRGSTFSEKTYDVAFNLASAETPGPEKSDVPIASASLVASDQAAVDAFAESYQKLVVGHNHLKKKLAKLTLLNRWGANLRSIIDPLEDTEGGGPPPILPTPAKPSTKTTTNGKASEANVKEDQDYESSSSYYTPPTSFRSISRIHQRLTIRKMELRHVTGEAMVMQECRTFAGVQTFGVIEEYSLDMNSIMNAMNPEPDPDPNTDPYTEKDQEIILLPTPVPAADSNAASRGAGAGAYSDLIQQMNRCRIAHKKMVKNAINDKEKDILAQSFTEMGPRFIRSASTGNRETETPSCEFFDLLHSRAPMHSMVTCLTSNGISTQAPEYEGENGWTSTMVERLLVTALSSLPIPIKVHTGTQTEMPENQPRPTTPRRSGLKATRQVKVEKKGVEVFKRVLVGTTQMLLFIMLIVAYSYPEIRCLPN
ncbi:uncharacterized protein LOC117185834 isoform X2 [Drosophila miranda]|uniref:uncharacterized protein LOC117185834 isoform X2 n=1 Tax=Drosophila miranda TaxID=7229 RepID=UPI0007E69F43|nr:uncharacterized protein LOC117185834 isoform X2 [Drosophila miranda]